eukprot:948971-Pleurochrysis_carterae.AAC.2
MPTDWRTATSAAPAGRTISALSGRRGVCAYDCVVNYVRQANQLRVLGHVFALEPISCVIRSSSVISVHLAISAAICPPWRYFSYQS